MADNKLLNAELEDRRRDGDLDPDVFKRVKPKSKKKPRKKAVKSEKV